MAMPAFLDIHRVSKSATAGAPLRARVLVLAMAPDAPSQYIPTMNCIFSAQRAVCCVGARAWAGEVGGGRKEEVAEGEGRVGRRSRWTCACCARSRQCFCSRRRT
jgi:hypothetical protein